MRSAAPAVAPSPPFAADLDVYRHQGFGRSAGFGTSPALVIVDFVQAFADPALFGGGNIPDAIMATRDLLAFARAEAWPIATTRVVFADGGSDANMFTAKVPGLLRLTEANLVDMGQKYADVLERDAFVDAWRNRRTKERQDG